MARSGAMGASPVLLMLASAALLCYALLSFLALPSILQVEKGCRMSLMYPSYVSHNEALRMHSRSSSPVMHKYSLLEYREGGAKHELGGRSASAALFIPGNAGSYGQVRSMASSGANQYWTAPRAGYIPVRDRVNDEWKDAPGPIDWYTLDFNEDFSAFHGQTMLDQAYFVNEVVHYLRSLYPPPDNGMVRGDERNGTVALVAHSMGGIVARLAQRIPNYVPRSIDTIITLSTPHAFPPVPFDRSVERVYRQINRKWSMHEEEEPLLISIAGGLLDTQLSSDASSLSLAGIQAPSSRISTFTSSLALLWGSVDHLAVVWCDQLRYKVARGLLLDYQYFGKIAEDRAHPMRRIERRELWRKLLGVTNDGATHEERQIEALAAHSGDTRLRDLTPVLERNNEGKDGVLMLSPGASLHAVLTGPGPRTVYDVNASHDEPLSFELVTNLCVGTSPNRGAIIYQNIELVTQVCHRSILPSHPTHLKKARCRIVMPSAYETLPPSPPPQDPDIQGRRFPNATLLYEVPSASIKRLHFSAEYLRENEIEFIRVERTLDAGMYTGSNSLHRQTLLSIGWNEAQEVVLRGAPWLGSRSWALPGTDLRKLVSSFANNEQTLRWQWRLPNVDSSLMAYNLELEPAPCAMRYNYSTLPRTAPMLRVTNIATNDARSYPSLDVLRTVRVPFALHGSAPFMPRAPKEHRGTLVELWVPDTFQNTMFESTFSLECPLPYNRMRLHVHWRGSAAMLVLRYRFALLTWPIAVLALAHATFFTSIHAMPIDALCSLATHRSMAGLLAAPFFLQLVVCFAEALRFPGLWYTLGIGTTDLRFALLGPVLMLLAYGMALLMALLMELCLHTLYLGCKRFAPRWIPTLAAQPALPETVLPSGTELRQWALQRRTLVTAGILVGCWILLPYQVLVLVCFLVHCATMAGSYIANQEAQIQPHRMEEWERDVAPHETQHARILRALQSQYSQHTWLSLLLLWMLPLHIPALVVWVRNVNVGVRMGLSRTEHSIGATLALLALVYMYASSSFYERPKQAHYTTATRGIYLLLFLVSLVYGIRFAFVQYELFQIVLAWEVLHRLYALFHRPIRTEHAPSEREVFVLEPMPLSLPATLGEVDTAADILRARTTPSREDFVPLDVRSLREQLDHLLATYLATLEAYLDARTRASDEMAAGFAQLTRAKVAMGGPFGQRLSRDAYDERMQAQVLLREGRLETVAPHPESYAGHTDKKDAAQVANLRRRTARNDTVPAAPSHDGETSDAPRAPKGFDPLFQFSGLPPSSLRSAQKHFQDALSRLLDNHADAGPSQQTVLPLLKRLEELHQEIVRSREALRIYSAL